MEINLVESLLSSELSQSYESLQYIYSFEHAKEKAYKIGYVNGVNNTILELNQKKKEIEEDFKNNLNSFCKVLRDYVKEMGVEIEKIYIEENWGNLKLTIESKELDDNLFYKALENLHDIQKSLSNKIKISLTDGDYEPMQEVIVTL